MRIRSLLSTAAMACSSAVLLAQDPARLAPATRGLVPARVPHPPPLNPGDEIYNTLDIMHNQLYDYGNGDAWSGLAVFGPLYDLQVADDIDLDDRCCLTVLVRDYVCFFGNAPANGCYVALHRASGGLPEEAAFLEADGVPTEVYSYSDSIFGLEGIRLTARMDGSMCADADTYFLVQQPHDETVTGDWYYSIADSAGVIGFDRAMRDGGRGEGGYGWTTWRSGGESGLGAGTVSMAVRVKCPGSEPRCVYEVVDIGPRSSVCGSSPCDTCPYAVGDLLCSAECTGGEERCRTRLKGWAGCANGSTCRILANLVGCETPPGNCRLCP